MLWQEANYKVSLPVSMKGESSFSVWRLYAINEQITTTRTLRAVDISHKVFIMVFCLWFGLPSFGPILMSLIFWNKWITISQLKQ
jgi:hypothetical protein